ncbi:MAG: exodeoxyribonuclease VII small subunit [Acidobacteriia bacterium]|nr:exodeoxyribonuclease VII small subunit [Terriglobia bacterium]
MVKQKTQDFESAIKRLEEIVSQLESGDLQLEKSLELFEEGIQLSRFCHGKLDEAERKVEVLLKDAEGEMKRAPFEGESAATKDAEEEGGEEA